MMMADAVGLVLNACPSYEDGKCVEATFAMTAFPTGTSTWSV